MPGFEPRQGLRKNASPRVSSCSHRPLTPKRVTVLVLRRPELTGSNEREAIARLQTAHSDLESALELAQQFASLVRQRLPEQLDAQLIIAKEVDLAEKNLFTSLLNEVEEMQSILVASLNKLKV